MKQDWGTCFVKFVKFSRLPGRLPTKLQSLGYERPRLFISPQGHEHKSNQRSFDERPGMERVWARELRPPGISLLRPSRVRD